MADTRARGAGDGSVEDGAVRARFVVDIPHGLHARPAALLVRAARGADVRIRNVSTESDPVSAKSLNDIMVLGILEGHELEVVATGPNAAETVAAIVALAERGFDDRAAAPKPATSPGLRDGATAIPAGALMGSSASPGVVVAPARRFHVPELPVPDAPSRGAVAESAALDAGIAAARADVEAQRAAVAAASGTAWAAIFDAHLLLLEDEAILRPVRDAIAGGASAARAWRDAIDAAARAWGALDDPYLRARAGDLRSVGAQTLAHLLGVPLPAPELEDPGILVADDLAPADAAGLDPEVVLGVVTAAGGPTSHAALLTRALGIPAVVGVGTALGDLAEGTVVALDGAAGFIVADPPDDLRAAFADRAAREREVAERARAKARARGATADGVAIEVAANIGSPDEVAAAVAAGCDGVGLFRTELLFLGRTDLPDEDEQADAYRRAAVALEGRPLVIRTLDVGADKPLPILRQEPEANPFLGLRGLRLGLAHPELLATQLRAIARVAAEHPLRVMFPMVATLEEFRAARGAYDAARAAVSGGTAEVGVMVEVPAAALAADRLAAEVDFFSIGTNDLTQYVFAAERGNERVARIADPFHPALLGLVARTAAAGASAGRWTGVCGEFASDPLAAVLLVGLGVRELSMGAPAIALVKDALRGVTLADAEALAHGALAAGSADEVRALLRGAAAR